MAERILIKNGLVVNASGSCKADVLVADGRISEVGESLHGAGARTVDASGCYVMPGFIDTHTHFDLDTGAAVTADDFISGSRAAVLGGTTTVLDYASQSRGGTLAQALSQWHTKAKGASCNYGFHMGVSEWNDDVAAEFALMEREGVTSYKMYMVYESMRVDDGELYAALKCAKRFGSLLCVHCENWDVLLRRIIELKAQGITGPEGHPLSRPAEVEAEAVARYMRIAQLADAPAYVVHLSTAEGLVEARRARQRGQTVYLETCPQYLLLTAERYSDPDGAKFVMSPPLRAASDNAVLWLALAMEEVDTVGTDHCSFNMAQKLLHKDDFTQIPNGGVGVQNRAQLVYTYGVKKGTLKLEQMVGCLSANPARIFGMHDHGEIAPGKAADIVIWQDEQGVITDTNTAHRCDNTPFNGFETLGNARDVILNGKLTVQAGRLVEAGGGRYIARKRCF